MANALSSVASIRFLNSSPHANSGGGRGGRPCAARARSQSGLWRPSAQDAWKSRQGDARFSYTEQRTALPMSPSRAMQRAGLRSVPRIATRCRVTGSVSSAGTRPSGAAVVSNQWKDARKKAQQAPQDRQGFDIHAEAAPADEKRCEILLRNLDFGKRLSAVADRTVPDVGYASPGSVARSRGRIFEHSDKLSAAARAAAPGLPRKSAYPECPTHRYGQRVHRARQRRLLPRRLARRSSRPSAGDPDGPRQVCVNSAVRT